MEERADLAERAQGASAPVTNRPYPPPSNVAAIVQRIRSRNLPERVDADYLRDAGTPEGTVGRVLFALRFLGLIEGESPSATLRAIATSTDEEYREILAGVLRDSYRDVFQAVDPTQDGQDRILNVFRRYTPGSQRERMVIFFLGMCREAGIPTLDTPRQRGTVISSPGRVPARAVSGGRSTTARKATASARSQVGNVPAPREQEGGLHPALEMLIRSLPPTGAGMTAEQRERWVEMARATLTYVYPEAQARVSFRIEGDEEAADEEGEDENT